MVNVSEIVRALINDTAARLKTVFNDPSAKDPERKTRLLEYVQRTRHKLLRLRVLLKWCQESHALIERSQALRLLLEDRTANVVNSADILFEFHNMSRFNPVRLPLFQVSSAAQILCNRVPELPAIIKRIGQPPATTPSDAAAAEALKNLNRYICARLLRSNDGTKFTSLKIENGQVRCTVEHEFEMWLTLEGSSGDTPWRLLEVEILVESIEGRDVDRKQTLHIIYILQQALQAHKSDQPLNHLCTLTRSFCVQLQMDILSMQAEKLQHCNWLREKTSDPSHTVFELKFWSRTHGIDTEGSSIQIGLDLSISDRLLLSVSPTLEGVQSNTLNKQMFTDGKLNIKGLVQWVKQRQSHRRIERLHESLSDGMDEQTIEKHLKLCEGDPTGSAFTTLELRLSEFQSMAVHVDLWSGNYVLQSSTMSMQMLQDLQRTLNSDVAELPGFFTGMQRRSRSIEMYSAAKMAGMQVFLKGLPFLPSFDGLVPSVPPKLTCEHTVYIRFPHCPSTFLSSSLNEDSEPVFSIISSTGEIAQPVQGLPELQPAPEGSRKRKAPTTKASKSKQAKTNSSTKAEHTQAGGTDDIRSTYAELLTAAMKLNRSAAQKMELVQMLNSARVSFKEAQHDKLACSIECEPLSSNEATVSCNASGGFTVVLMQHHSLFTTRSLHSTNKYVQSASGLGKFSHTAAALTFEYDKNANWDTFVKDLQAVRTMTRLCKEVEVIAAARSQSFQIEEMTFVQIRLVYDHASSAPQRLDFRVSYDDSQTSQIDFLHFPHCADVDPHLAVLLKRDNCLTPMLEALELLWPCFKIVQQFVQATAGYTLTMHNHQQARLLHVRTLNGFDIQFHPGNQVRFCAAPRAPGMRISVPKLNDFISTAIRPIVAGSTHTGDVFIPQSQLALCLDKAHLYMGCAFLFAILEPGRKYQQSLGSVKLEFAIHDYSKMTLKLTQSVPITELASNIRLYFEVFKSFVERRMGPYDNASLKAVMTLLIIPIGVLPLFIEILRRETNPETYECAGLKSVLICTSEQESPKVRARAATTSGVSQKHLLFCVRVTYESGKCRLLKLLLSFSQDLKQPGTLKLIGEDGKHRDWPVSFDQPQSLTQIIGLVLNEK